MSRIGSIKLLTILALLVAALGPHSALAEEAQRSTADVFRLSDSTQVEGAWSTLVRGDSGVSMTLHTSELPPGHAFTVWWVVFNNPEACIGGGLEHRCGIVADVLFNSKAAGVSGLWATGHVIGESGVGDFAAHLAVGDTGLSACGLTEDGMNMPPCGNGLTNPRGADIHLIVRDHGKADPAMVQDQIHSFGACNSSCTDRQASVHESGS